VSHLRPIFTSFQDFDYETAIWDLAGWSHDRKRLKNVLAENRRIPGINVLASSDEALGTKTARETGFSSEEAAGQLEFHASLR
jgi:hypothetical protein